MANKGFIEGAFADRGGDGFTWLYRSIIGILVTLIGSGWYFVMNIQGEMVTKEDLQSMAPWVRDKDVVMRSIGRGEQERHAMLEAIKLMNEKFTKENHELDIRLSRLEERRKI